MSMFPVLFDHQIRAGGCALTDSIDGAVLANATFTHEADFLGKITVADNGSDNATRIFFRRQDDNNTWAVLIDASGNTSLYEVTTAGSWELRANGGAAAVNGAVFKWVADDETITGYVDDVQTWTYGSAAGFKTLTAGKIYTIATDGDMQDLEIWPRGCPSGDSGKW